MVTALTGWCGGGFPYVVFPHGMLDPYFRRAFPLKHFKKQVYWLARECRMLRDARAVCFTTAIERDCSRQRRFGRGGWKSVVVSLGISEPDGEPVAQREAFSRGFRVAGAEVFFVFVAHSSEEGVRFAAGGFWAGWTRIWIW